MYLKNIKYCNLFIISQSYYYNAFLTIFKLISCMKYILHTKYNYSVLGRSTIFKKILTILFLRI